MAETGRSDLGACACHKEEGLSQPASHVKRIGPHAAHQPRKRRDESLTNPASQPCKKDRASRSPPAVQKERASPSQPTVRKMRALPSQPAVPKERRGPHAAIQPRKKRDESLNNPTSSARGRDGASPTQSTAPKERIGPHAAYQPRERRGPCPAN